MTVERYGVYWVDLNPVLGSEMAKVRPAVVVSDNLMNRYLETVVVCPLTSVLHPAWRSRVAVTCAGQPAEVAVDQIRTIAKQRIGQRLDALGTQAQARLREVIMEMYGTE